MADIFNVGNSIELDVGDSVELGSTPVRTVVHPTFNVGNSVELDVGNSVELGSGPKDYNLARGVGERVGALGGGIVSVPNTLADKAESILPLGQITIDSSGVSYDRNNTDKSKNVIERTQSALQDIDLGYIPGTTWEQVKQDPISSKTLNFIIEQGIVSTPDMVAAVAALPAYIAARTGEISDERAKADARTNATMGDLFAAMPTAVAAAALERFGAKGILGIGEDVALPALKEAGAKAFSVAGAKAIGQAGAKEAATEFGQEVIEDFGTTAGTKTGFDVSRAVDAGFAGAVAGGGYGSIVRTATLPFDVKGSKEIQPDEEIDPAIPAGAQPAADIIGADPEQPVATAAPAPTLGTMAENIVATIDTAAAKYGQDSNTLRGIGWLESKGDPNAANSKSRARGLFQFMPETADQYGLENRFDPVQSADAAARLLRDNRNYLIRELGREPTPGELYLAHQQGAGGATKLLANPGALAVAVVGQKEVLLNGGSVNMTAGQFAQMWTSRLDGGGTVAVGPAQTFARPTPPMDLDSFLADDRSAAELLQADNLLSTFEPTNEWQVAPAGFDAAGLQTRRDVNTGQTLVRRPPTEGSVNNPIKVQSPEDIDTAANLTAEPTPAQAEAGNYRKRHVDIAGLPIAIETEKGQVRRGIAPDGKEWSVTMPAPYGYVKRTKGADGDQVDVYLGPAGDGVYVVDQIDPATGQFDEHKVMLGFTDEDSAMDTYEAGFSDGSGGQRIGGVTSMTVGQFRDWLKNGNNKKPIQYRRPRVRGKVATRKGPYDLMQFIASIGGIRDEGGEMTHMGLRHHFIPGFGRMVRSGGLPLDRVREAAEEAGYIRPTGFGTTWVTDLLEAIDASARGAKLYPRGHEIEQLEETPAGERPEAEIKDEIEKTVADLGGRLLDGEMDSILSLVAAGEAIDDAITLTFERSGLEEEASIDATEGEAYDDQPPFDTAGTDGVGQEIAPVSEPEGQRLDARTEAGTPPPSQQPDRGEQAASEESNAERVIGQNFDGLDIYEDANGVRSIVAENGMRFTETPGARAANYEVAEPPVDKTSPDSETVADKPGKPSAEPATDIQDQSGTDKTDKTRMQELRDRLSEHFLEGDRFATIVQARKFAEEITGREFKPNTPAVKELEEVIESAIVNSAREVVRRDRSAGKGPVDTFDALVDLYQRQPKLGERTSTSIANQAYSTPAPLAFLAATRAEITGNQTVLEPSAGTGMLLMTAQEDKIFANELNQERVSLLAAEYPGARIRVGDAMADRVGLQSDEKFDRIITNPPFGKVKDGKDIKRFKVDKLTVTAIDQAIAWNALKQMKDDGKAVLIIGSPDKARDQETRKKAYRTQAQVLFFKNLYSKFNVTDHFTVDGSMYHRQGAGWPVDVIVIDGRGKSSKRLPNVTVPEVFEEWPKLRRKLYDADMDAAEQSAQAGSGAVSEAAEQTSDTRSVSRPAGGPDTEAGQQSDTGGNRPGIGPDVPGGQLDAADQPDRGGADAEQRPDSGTDRVPLDPGNSTLVSQPEGGTDDAGGQPDAVPEPPVRSGTGIDAEIDSAIDDELDALFGEEPNSAEADQNVPEGEVTDTDIEDIAVDIQRDLAQPQKSQIHKDALARLAALPSNIAPRVQAKIDEFSTMEPGDYVDVLSARDNRKKRGKTGFTTTLFNAAEYPADFNQAVHSVLSITPNAAEDMRQLVNRNPAPTNAQILREFNSKTGEHRSGNASVNARKNQIVILTRGPQDKPERYKIQGTDLADLIRQAYRGIPKSSVENRAEPSVTNSKPGELPPIANDPRLTPASRTISKASTYPELWDFITTFPQRKNRTNKAPREIAEQVREFIETGRNFLIANRAAVEGNAPENISEIEQKMAIAQRSFDKAFGKVARFDAMSLAQYLAMDGTYPNPNEGIDDRQKSETGADGKEQLVIPGAEQITQREQAERLATGKKSSSKPQKDPGGLFGDAANSPELFDAPQTPQKPVQRSEPTAAPSSMDDVANGLDALFSDDQPAFKIRDKNGEPEFDKATYEKAKPFFAKGMANFADQAAGNVADMAKALVRALVTTYNFTREKIRRMQPYIRQFVKDVQAGKITLAADQAPTPAPKAKKRSENKEVETEHQVQYEPTSEAKFAVGTLVPRNMQTAMSAALDRLSERVGAIDQYVADKLDYKLEEVVGGDKPGYFSAEQVDALALAIDNVERDAGFIIGDQTGVGKGRFVAAMLRYAHKQGRVPVFVTKDPGLYADMVRDFRDIGMDDVAGRVFITNNGLRNKTAIPLSEAPGDVIQSMPQAKQTAAVAEIAQKGKLPEGMDYLFTTYSQMQYGPRGTEIPRQAAMLAVAPNAMFILDESHEAGGTDTKKIDPETGKEIPTRADFVRGLLQDARGVVFSSATYAKNPTVMSLYAKTDLSLAVDKIDDLGDTIAAGGVPLQQVVANMLVEAGQYARRERSYDGVSIEMKQVGTRPAAALTASEQMREIFQFDAFYMTQVREDFAELLQEDGEVKTKDGSIGVESADSVGFASVMHNVVSQMLLALKAKGVADEAIEQFKAGRKPILSVMNTNQSILQDFADDQQLTVGDDINIQFNTILDRYLQRLRRVTVKDADGEKHHIIITDDHMKRMDHGHVPALFRKLEKAIADADLRDLPASPIDYLRERLEAAGMNVGEITGRSLITKGGKLQRREASTKAKKDQMNAYNSGKLDALVINRSGSTGFSMHATALKGNDGKPRHMIILQPDANIDVFMQMLGRIHRTGQIVLPSYTIAVSDLAVEKRVAAVLMRKMSSLNANTTASKKSAVSLDNVVDFMNPYGDQVVHAYLQDNYELVSLTNVPMGDGERPAPNIAAKFTGRLAILPNEQVKEIYSEIERNYVEHIENLDRLGMNALEARTLDLEAVTLSSTELRPAQPGVSHSPFAQAANLETVDVAKLGSPFTVDEIETQVRENIDASGAKSSAGMVKQIGEKLQDLLPAYQQSTMAKIEKLQSGIKDLKTEKQRDSAKAHIENLQNSMRQDGIKIEQIVTTLRELAPGTAHIMSVGMDRQAIPDPSKDKEGTANLVYAMVTNIDTSRVDKNPTAMGKIRVTFALSDASREITVPLSQIVSASSSYSYTPLRNTSGVIPPAMRRMIEDGGTEVREQRQMITGNIVSGFATFGAGQIVVYTDSDGNTKQGILMPRGFEGEKELENMPAEFKTPSQAIEFLTADPGKRQVKSKDGKTRIVSTEDYQGKVSFTLEVSKRGGKPYYLNQTVRDVVGDFQSRGGTFFQKRDVDSDKVAAVMSAWQDQVGAEFITETSKDEARAIIEKSAFALRVNPNSDRTEVINYPKANLRVETVFRSEFTDKEAALRKSLREELNDMGLTDVGMRLVDSIRVTDGTDTVAADGRYSRRLIDVALDSPSDPKSIMNHEAFHALWRLGLFTDQEMEILKNNSRSKWIGQFNIAQTYTGQSADMQIEEGAAHAFQSFRETGKQGGIVRRLFDKISGFLEGVGNALRGNGFKTVDSIFAAAKSGEVGERARRSNQGGTALAKSIKPAPKAKRSLLLMPGAVRAMTMMERLKSGQPIDRVIRIPFEYVGGFDEKGNYLLSKWAGKHLMNVLKNGQFSEKTLMRHMNPVMENIRAGIGDRYGLDPEYTAAERRRQLALQEITGKIPELMDNLRERDVGIEEAKVLQAILTGENVDDADMQALAAPIRAAIDELGQEAVALGLVSRESFERNRGTYLHRVYEKYETDASPLVKMAENIFNRRRKSITGEALKGRGIFVDVETKKLTRDDPEFWKARRGKPIVGEKVRILDLYVEQSDAITPDRKKKIDRRVILPAGQPVPAKYASFTDKGVWEIRAAKGKDKHTLWRDYTPAERKDMGEILDARYTIAKTYMLMANDLANGRYFKEIAENGEWTVSMPPAEGTWREASEFRRSVNSTDVKWIKVPDVAISNTGGKKRYGALSGKFVRAEIWRDIKEIEIMNRPTFWRKLMTQWKMNKTVRNLVVHMNNIMSNLVFMDMADIRLTDLARGIKSFITQDEHYQRAKEGGAFGADLVTNEIRDQVFKPVLAEIAASQKKGPGASEGPESRAKVLGTLFEKLWGFWLKFDDVHQRAYRAEDEIFRMATFIRRRELGDPAEQAATFSREQFLDYDIRAPWINFARNTGLPFFAYTYRAVPVIARSITYHPQKLIKYFLIAYALNALAYGLDEEDADEQRERGSLWEQEQGFTWIGVPRLLRMPWRDQHGLPTFLDIRRWIPAGDVFDTNQGNAALPVPAPLMFGGPLALGAELYLNKISFTGKEITKRKTDTGSEQAWKLFDYAWKSWMPAAAWVPNSWYQEKLWDAWNGALDRQDRRLSLSQAALSSLGIKIKPQDVDAGYARHYYGLKKMEEQLKYEAWVLADKEGRMLIDEAEFNKGMDRILAKLDVIADEAVRLSELQGR